MSEANANQMWQYMVPINLNGAIFTDFENKLKAVLVWKVITFHIKHNEILFIFNNNMKTRLAYYK